jgi:hypothetical protein
MGWWKKIWVKKLEKLMTVENLETWVRSCPPSEYKYASPKGLSSGPVPEGP